MTTEDFSFPRIGDTCPCGVDSPPLWNLSPAGSPNSYQAFREGNRGDGRYYVEEKLKSQGKRKSFPKVENGRKRVGVSDEEDKMDMLWEDFNEESTTSSSRATAELRGGPKLAVAKTSNGALLPAKNNKPSILLVVKVLKKLFSLHNSEGKTRKRARIPA